MLTCQIFELCVGITNKHLVLKSKCQSLQDDIQQVLVNYLDGVDMAQLKLMLFAKDLDGSDALTIVVNRGMT